MSTAESELMAAIEAMQMTQSVEALLMVVKPQVEFEKVLYGDNSSALAILQNPDGPWRTRHLRLRAHCLREKLRCETGSWKVRHQKGTALMADLLTKPITQASSWKRFWEFLEFWTGDESEGTTYENEDVKVKNSNHPDGNESAKGLEVKLQVAKIGIVLGLVEKARSLGGDWRMTLLCFILTILLIFFLLELKRVVHTRSLTPVNHVQESFHQMKGLKLINVWEEKIEKKGKESKREEQKSLNNKKKEVPKKKRKTSEGRRDDEPRPTGEIVEKMDPAEDTEKETPKGIRLNVFGKEKPPLVW